MKPYRALNPFRSTSRPDLGTVLVGDVVSLEPAHAAALAEHGLVGDVDAAPEPSAYAPGHTVGATLGGGWVEVLGPDGTVADKVRGREAAQARAEALDGRG